MFVTNKRFELLKEMLTECRAEIKTNDVVIKERITKFEEKVQAKLEEFEVKVKQYENDRPSLQYFEGDFIEMKNDYKKLYNAYNDLKNKVEKGKK